MLGADTAPMNNLVEILVEALQAGGFFVCTMILKKTRKNYIGVFVPFRSPENRKSFDTKHFIYTTFKNDYFP